MKSVQVKKTFKGPEQPGLYYRLLCLTGQNKGTSYYLKGSRLILGRGQKVDIPVLDANSSKMHAEMAKIGEEYVLTDLGSLNGVFINDERVVQKHLSDGDRLIIGKTVYKYDVIDVPQNLTSILGIKKEEEEEEEGEDEEKVTPEVKEKKPLNKKILIGVGVVAVLFLFDTDEKPKTVKRKPASAETKGDSIDNDFKSFRKTGDKEADKALRDKLAGAIHRGLRELREKNYFRAIQEFNMALILHPNHARASFYLSKTKQSLDDEISLNFLRGRREMDALKYEGAIVSNCQVINLLEGYESDERFKEAKENIEQLEEKLGLDKGATKCTKR